MAWWDSLLGLFPKLKDFKGEVKLTCLSGNKTTIINNDNRKIFQININDTRTIDQSHIKDAIRKAVQNNNDLLIEDESEKTLKAITASEESNNNILNYFYGKIPSGDYSILRAALFLKSQFDDGKPVDRLKRDIVDKYGERGKNISNLCTAGYFETVIKPLYEEMVKTTDDPSTKFIETYEVIIAQYPFAIFVNKMMSVDELKKVILGKITRNKKYGINYLRIHGIGEDNVRKISQILTDKDIQKEFSALPEINSGQTFFNVKICFACNNQSSGSIYNKI